MRTFFKDYFAELKNGLDQVNSSLLVEAAKLVSGVKNSDKKIIIVGNGGSASIADHVVVDFVNAAGIRAVNFNNPGLITCFANDYKYENWVSLALERYAESGDLAILISSSGQSNNMIFGAQKAQKMGMQIITFTGFEAENSLRKWGDINFWVDSKKYNIVEMTHHVWLLSIVDYIIYSRKK